MAVVGNDGSLSLIDATGRSVVLATSADATFAFPVWSPDGSRIAAIRTGSENLILVFDARRALAGPSVEPVVIFRSTAINPFYLSWAPDGRAVSFLADQSGVLSLRIASADGSAPLDGSGPGAKIRSGNPLYFDWVARDRLLAHVGSGPDEFLGEIGLNGAPAGRAIAAPGIFRPAVVSPDRKYFGYVRAGSAGSEDVVVATRDGSREHTMPVFGASALTFSPTGDTIAALGFSDSASGSFQFPVGPVRVMDGAGKIRTLLDGTSVGFWWSPDGATIAVLRVQPAAGGTATGSQAPTPSPGLFGTPLPSPTSPPPEVRLLFVDVASGAVLSQPVVHPGQLFIDQLLNYFDQYALSHRLWAPDSSSFLFPEVDQAGTTTIALMHPNGDPPGMIDGAIGFWSP